MNRPPGKPLTIPGGLGWDRVLRAFFALDGDCAALGAEAAICLLALQASANWDTGEVSESHAALAARTGISHRSIARAMDVIRAAEYLEPLQHDAGKVRRYRIRRWIIARTPHGDEIPVSWLYTPRTEGERLTALGTWIKAGGGQPPPTITVHVHVDQMQVVLAGGQGVQIQGGNATDVAKARSWWQTLPKSAWDDNLQAAGVPVGPITDASKVAAWLAAGCPGRGQP